MPLKTPDITPAQVIAFVATITGLLVSQGTITNHAEKIITGWASVLVPVVLVVADAILRHGRAKIVAAHVEASLLAGEPPDERSSVAQREAAGE